MKAISYLGLALLASVGYFARPARAQEIRPLPANAVSVNMQQAAPILESWRKGQGWVFATLKTESNGERFAKYRVVTGIHGSISVNSKSNILLTTAPETDWIPLRSVSVPVQNGPAIDVLSKAEAFLKDNAAVAILGDTGIVQRTTLPQLVSTIQPTVRGPGSLPTRTNRNPK